MDGSGTYQVDLVVLWGPGAQHLEILFHPFLQVGLVLPVDHSGRSDRGSRVFLVIPVLPGSLEIQVCRALPVVPAQLGRTPVDWGHG